MKQDQSESVLAMESQRQRRIEQLKPVLLHMAEEVFPDGARKPEKMGYTQIRNLVGHAQAASCILELQSFVRYQMARDSNKKGWQANHQEKPFGEIVNSKLDKIERLAKQELPGDSHFPVQAAAYFFGFLSWRAKYVEMMVPQATGGGKHGK